MHLHKVIPFIDYFKCSRGIKSSIITFNNRSLPANFPVSIEPLCNLLHSVAQCRLRQLNSIRATNQVSNLIAKQQPQATHIHTHTHAQHTHTETGENGSDPNQGMTTTTTEGEMEMEMDNASAHNTCTHTLTTHNAHTHTPCSGTHSKRRQSIARNAKKLRKPSPFVRRTPSTRGNRTGVEEGGGEGREKKEHLLSSQLDRSPAEVQL